MKLGKPTIASQQAVDDITAAARRNADKIGPGFLLPSLHGDLHGNGQRTVTQGPGLGLGKRRELVERADIERRAHD
jgi:hypothetical protein